MADIIKYESKQSDLSARRDPKYSRELAVKLKGRFTEHTLAYVKQLWKSLATSCLLPDLPVLLDKIRKGCIAISWLVPTEAVQMLIERGRQCTGVFREYQIVHVEIDGVCIYDSATDEEVGEPAADEVSGLLCLRK